MSPGELGSEVRGGRLRPAYLLAGGEALLRDDALAAIREAVLGEGPVDFNLQRLEGDKSSAGELQDAVRALPVLAERRLVVLREPEGRRRGKGAAEGLAEVVAEVCEQETTVLVVLAEKVDKRSRWVKAFKEPAGFVDCDPPRNVREAAGFVRADASRQGLELGRGAAEALAEAVGPQLLLLRSELEKASLLAGPGEKITREVVVESATQLAEEPIWDLTDAIGEGRSGDALGVLGHMLDGGAAPPMLLGSLASHFRKLTRARHGERPKGPPFLVKKLERQAARYTPARLLACMKAIHEVDEILKGSGNLDPELALERLVLGLSA